MLRSAGASGNLAVHLEQGEKILLIFVLESAIYMQPQSQECDLLQ